MELAQANSVMKTVKDTLRSMSAFCHDDIEQLLTRLGVPHPPRVAEKIVHKYHAEGKIVPLGRLGDWEWTETHV
jgi:hypothetical protein